MSPKSAESWYKWVTMVLLTACAFFVSLSYYDQRKTHNWMIKHSMEFKNANADKSKLWEEVEWINHYLAKRDKTYYYQKYHY